MKKLFIIAGISTLLFSCEKNTQPSFTASNQTGTTQFYGNITRAQASGSNTPAAGVYVTVTIKNTALYPNSPTAQGSQTYSGFTDVNGNFNITVTTNGGGAAGTVVISNTEGVYDPIGGANAIFAGTQTTLTFTSGVPVDYNYNMPLSSITGTSVTGTATVSGTVYVTLVKEENNLTYHDSAYALANYPVQLNFTNDPTTQIVKAYSATTDANGHFIFTIATTNQIVGTFPDQAKLYINPYSTTQDTIKLSGRVTGVMGYYPGTTVTISNLIPNAISNTNAMTYGVFIPNL